MSLPPNQRLFVVNYLIDRNGTQAAIRAGFSEATAGQTAHELLKKPEIVAAIQKGLDRLANKAEISAIRVLEEFRRIAFSNPGDVLEWKDGKIALSDSDDLPPEVMACISEVRETKQGLVVKFHDKNKALDAIARHLGLFEADNLLRIRNETDEQRAAAEALDDILERATPEQLEVLDALFSHGPAEGESDAGQPAH